MFGRSGKAAAALVCALGGCSADAPADPLPEVSAPPQALYDLQRPTGGLPAPRARDASFVRGVALGALVGDDGKSRDDSVFDTYLDEILATGATDVELAVHWGQQDTAANEITPLPSGTVDDGSLARLMARAAKKSLRVRLTPVLDVGAPTSTEARAALAPSDPERWWWSYRRFLLHYARLAQANDAVVFCVGRGMDSLQADTVHWGELIGDVRKFFHGSLTYVANLSKLESVGFWDALDSVSISMDVPLADVAAADDEALRAGLAARVQPLRAWAKEQGKGFVLVDVGYPAHEKAALRPAPGKLSGPADPTMQLRSYRAVYDVLQSDPLLSGVYVASWAGDGGPQDAGFTPRGRPSAAVLRHWFQGSAAKAPAAADTAAAAQP